MSILQQGACSHTVTSFDRQLIEKVKSSGGKMRACTHCLSKFWSQRTMHASAPAGDQQRLAAQGLFN
ncbi:MAG: hypothetical protein ACO3KY_09700 [Lysobacterales bacterium]